MDEQQMKHLRTTQRPLTPLTSVPLPHLAKAVQLQAACADRVHDRCVVDDPHRDALLPRPQLQVCVCRCTKGVAHNEERDVLLLRSLQDLLC